MPLSVCFANHLKYHLVFSFPLPHNHRIDKSNYPRVVIGGGVVEKVIGMCGIPWYLLKK